nr:50S ribosomal protein L31 [uncultured Ruminococcus sp.]
MQEKIHPNYGQTTITCACGNVIETGKQKLVDTGGRVDRFKKRFGMEK